ncbi:hypothetical protein GGX14DRAFT_386571 [Mycena pura]|uniref:Uncharacterized protein n=1 Tax=Mycena pura TaxID=153505 RepID=A0AAD6YQ77_9AGAR|nr:hypothetical protein GGX14DRAFT_386571 [Mycena pura]
MANLPITPAATDAVCTTLVGSDATAPTAGDSAPGSPPHAATGPTSLPTASSPPAAAVVLPAAVQLAVYLSCIVAEGGGHLVLLDMPMLSMGTSGKSWGEVLPEN